MRPAAQAWTGLGSPLPGRIETKNLGKTRAGYRDAEQKLAELKQELTAEAQAEEAASDPANYTLWDCITDWHPRRWALTRSRTSSARYAGRSTTPDASARSTATRPRPSSCPRPGVKPRDWDFLTQEQVETVLSSVEGTRMHALMVIGFECGLRPGELRALHWDDIDFRHQCLYVVRYLKGGVRSTSRREVPLSDRGSTGTGCAPSG